MQLLQIALSRHAQTGKGTGAPEGGSAIGVATEEANKDEAVTIGIADALPEIVGLGLAGRLEEVRELLRSGHDVNVVDGMGMSALHHAAKESCHGFASLLIECNADLDLRAEACHGDTPLHFACKYGHASMVSALLKHGAADNPVNDTGLTPEHCSVANGHSLCTSVLPRRVAFNKLLAEEELLQSRSTSASSWKSELDNNLAHMARWVFEENSCK